MFDYDKALSDPDNNVLTNINQSWLDEEDDDNE